MQVVALGKPVTTIAVTMERTLRGLGRRGRPVDRGCRSRTYKPVGDKRDVSDTGRHIAHILAKNAQDKDLWPIPFGPYGSIAAGLPIIRFVLNLGV